jgi:membrane protease YdiL (CAAX protease family)
MVYGSGLGREYFYFSFVPRSWRSTGFVFALMVAGLLIFLAANAVLGSISYTGALWRSSWHQLYEAVFIHLFIVGVSEELLFRGALLTLAAHWISRRFAPRRLSRFSRSAALLLISVLFGLVHAPHGLLMVFLAFWASLLYGLAFLVGKSLFGPVLLHGLLNVLLMMNYKLSLFQ